ncbi:hypothetical protein [Streptomyces liangshanensis]|uniref:hypothetical protein n=1 Tax=Streptomyces liangshanensis TaxID=2717324 RepID=UPI001FBA226B|nr:hypothetical protein [Streptomyces liangshanensis]
MSGPRPGTAFHACASASPRPGTAVLACASAALFAALAVLIAVRHGTSLPGDGAAHAWSVRHRPTSR